MSFICPSLEAAIYSLTDWDGFVAPAWVGIENFKRILTDQVFREAAIRIFIWTAFSILFKVGMVPVIAYVLTKAIRGIGFFRSVVLLPYIISASAMCLVFIIIYNKDIGLVNMLLKTAGLGRYTKHQLNDPKTAFYAVVLIPIYQAAGYFFVILFTAMKDVSSDLREAGRMDGINSLTELFLITLPTVWPIPVVCIILATNGTFQNFDYTFTMIYGGPGYAGEASVTYMYKSTSVDGEYGCRNAAALILFALAMVVTNYVRKGSNSRFTTD